jgi:hypothetical protein
MHLRAALLALAAAALLAGCGEDDDRDARGDAPRPAGAEPAFVTLPDVRAAFADAGLDTVETGLGPALDEEVPEPALAAKRYEIRPTSREFELYVFPDAALARDAVPDLRDTELAEEGGVVVRGANVVAAFPGQPEDFRGYRVVRRVLAGLPDRDRRTLLDRARPASLAAVLGDPDAFADAPVTVTGTVIRPLRGGASDFAFVLSDAGTDGRLLVVPADAQAVDAALSEGDRVRVTGRVRRLDARGDAPPDLVAPAGIAREFAGGVGMTALAIEEVER